jgi:hypothetical protein
MSKADEYRQFAKECAEWARSACSETERKQLLELARAWLITAKRADSVNVASVPCAKSLRITS